MPSVLYQPLRELPSCWDVFQQPFRAISVDDLMPDYVCAINLERAQWLDGFSPRLMRHGLVPEPIRTHSSHPQRHEDKHREQQRQ
jgi:hypothetical protein